MKKNKILFIRKYGANANFISNDIDILSGKYKVKEHKTKTTSDWKIIFGLLNQFTFFLINIFNTKLIYIWFADYHSFLPVLLSKIFRKKSIICAGGYECTYIPEIYFCVFTKVTVSKSIRNFCTVFSLKNCTLILPVDETLIENSNTYIYSDIIDKSPLEDGIRKFIPGIKTKIKALHLGYDHTYFAPASDIPKETALSSAGLIVNDDEYRRKGFDLLVESAKKLPQFKFILAGLNEYYLQKLTSLNMENLELHGIINYDALLRIYQRSRVFAQISMFEGMPSTICEAMLCECIPIGSNVNGIPKIIGDTGIIVFNKNINDIESKIRIAFESTEYSGTKARNRIIENFSLQNRKQKLLHEINTLLAGR
jgi:glycosyltransferase involved in cell wall biosynthesis